MTWFGMAGKAVRGLLSCGNIWRGRLWQERIGEYRLVGMRNGTAWLGRIGTDVGDSLGSASQVKECFGRIGAERTGVPRQRMVLHV